MGACLPAPFRPVYHIPRDLHMQLKPTPVTAALAGLFSALTWPLIWPLVRDPASSSTLWLVVAVLACIAVPAHAFVLGFNRTPAEGSKLDTPLMKRIAAWLAGGAAGAALLLFL